MRYVIALLMVALTLLLSGCPAVMVTGAGAGVAAAEDRRTLGTMAEDEGIELKTLARADERFGTKIHLNATSYNRKLVLTGEAPDAATRDELYRIGHSVPNVREVHNEVTIGPATSLASRSRDTLITTKVKIRFLDAQKFNALHVKVVTENQIVYLLGQVKRQEGKDAIDIARTTADVKKVVSHLEYID